MIIIDVYWFRLVAGIKRLLIIFFVLITLIFGLIIYTFYDIYSIYEFGIDLIIFWENSWYLNLKKTYLNYFYCFYDARAD